MITFDWRGSDESLDGVATYRFTDGNVKVPMPSFAVAFELQRAIDVEHLRIAERARRAVAAELEGFAERLCQ